jgi:2-polyprenyl-3-methyl-5-hydroxy-6-metoxy-1,4-benzoquinol methylase
VEEDLKKMNPKCRICSSLNCTYLCTVYNEHSETTELNIHRCNDCESVFVGNSIKSQELGAAYSTLDSKSYYDEIEVENKKKMIDAIQDLKKLTSTTRKIIDIGTGNGFFLELLREAGFSCLFAHEIPGGDLSKAKKITKKMYADFNYKKIPSNGFDVVTLLDVVEHVIDPKYLMEMVRRILKKGGKIYFHTPVVTITDRLMHILQKTPLFKKIGKIWQRGRTNIFHLENYTPKSLRMLLEETGFKDIEIEVKNELSWPVTRYIRIHLLEKQKLPTFLAPLLVPFFYPILATDFFNANKAIVSATKK